MRTWRVIFFTLWIIVGYSQVKDFQFYPITIEMGLPDKTVSAIVQDEDGFMWFATHEGLARYDGYRFKTFERSPSDTSSLVHNKIMAMMLDNEGDIWIGTEGGGACRLDPDTEKFKAYSFDSTKTNSIIGPEVYSILKDSRGDIWFGTKKDGACRLDMETKQFEYLRHDPKNPENSIGGGAIWNIFEDSKGQIWFSTWAIGYTVYDPRTKTFKHIQTGDNPEKDIETVYSGIIFEDSLQQLWMTNWAGGVDIYDLKKEVFVDHLHHYEGQENSLGSNEAWPIIQDNYGDIWIGTYNGGISLYHPKDHSFINFTPENSSLSHDNTWWLSSSRSGILWAGHDNGGITKIIRNEKKFRHFTHDKDDPSTLAHGQIRAIYEDRKGNLWLGDWAGNLNLFQGSGKFQAYGWPADRQKDKISCMLEDQQGRFWVGTYRGGLNLFNREKGVFETQYLPEENNPKSISGQYVYDLELSKDGKLWVATTKGLNLFDQENGTFTHVNHNNTDPKSLSSDEVITLFRDNEGVLWVGTENGLNKRNPDGTFTIYQNDIDDSLSLVHSTINAICDAHEGYLWIGTQAGISLQEKSTGRCQNYTISLKSNQNKVHGMLKDELGNLWISTKWGLIKFKIEEEEFIYYDNLKDGIQGIGFEQGACLKRSDGELLFGGQNGYNAFYPKEIKDNDYIPPVRFTSFTVNDQAYDLPRVIHKMDTINLVYDENNISFEFAALNYMIPEKNRYKYILEGYNEEWIDAGIRNYASYTNLSPGTYTFRVIGSNNDKQWNKEGTSIKIIITPPFWQTTGFYVFQSLFFVTLLGFSIYFNRSNKHNRIAKTLAFLSLFMIFEYIFVLVEPTVDEFSQGAAFFKVMMNLVLALTLIPVEKLVEKQYTKKESKAS